MPYCDEYKRKKREMTIKEANERWANDKPVSTKKSSWKHQWNGIKEKRGR